MVSKFYAIQLQTTNDSKLKGAHACMSLDYKIKSWNCKPNNRNDNELLDSILLIVITDQHNQRQGAFNKQYQYQSIATIYPLRTFTHMIILQIGISSNIQYVVSKNKNAPRIHQKLSSLFSLTLDFVVVEKKLLYFSFVFILVRFFHPIWKFDSYWLVF